MSTKEFPNEKILLVIPHYRHLDKLQIFLKELLQVLPDRFSIRISDDGSGENTFHQLENLVNDLRRRPHRENGARLLDVVASPINKGKGAAVFRGWEDAEGFDWLAFVDADGSISASEILRGSDWFLSSDAFCDVFFASRIQMLGRKVQRKWVRHLIGRVFATLVDGMTGIKVYDSQCGFKALRRSVYERIVPYCASVGFAFDVELLLLCKKFGFSIKEFPIDWEDRSGSKVKFLSDPISMILDIIRIKARIHRLSSQGMRDK